MPLCIVHQGWTRVYTLEWLSPVSTSCPSTASLASDFSPSSPRHVSVTVLCTLPFYSGQLCCNVRAFLQRKLSYWLPGFGTREIQDSLPSKAILKLSGDSASSPSRLMSSSQFTPNITMKAKDGCGHCCLVTVTLLIFRLILNTMCVNVKTPK